MHHTKGILPKQCQTFFPKFWSTFINKKTFTITSECLIFAFAVYPSENNMLSEYKMLIGDIFLRHCLGWISVPYICFVFVRIGSRQYLFHLENSIFLHEGNDSMRFFSKNSLTNYHNETYYWHRRCS